AEAQLKKSRLLDETFSHELPGELDVPELEDLDLRANALAAVRLRHGAQIPGRRAVERLIEVQRAAIEAPDLGLELDDVRDALTRPHEIGSLDCGSLRSEEHTSELQSRGHLVCRLLLEKKKK